MVGTRRSEAEVVLKDVDGLGGPSQLTGPLAEGILQAQAFLMAQPLEAGSIAGGK